MSLRRRDRCRLSPKTGSWPTSFASHCPEHAAYPDEALVVLRLHHPVLWSSRQGARGTSRKKSKARWNSTAYQFAKESHSGIDRLGYGIYAKALAGLFSTGDENILPAAVGIYAPWGGGKVRARNVWSTDRPVWRPQNASRSIVDVLSYFFFPRFTFCKG